MGKLSSVLAIARMYSAWSRRSRLWVVNQLIIPFSIYIMFSLLLGRGFEVNALIGGLVALAWNYGTTALSQQVFSYRYHYKFLDMFIASPVTPSIFVIGAALGTLLDALLPAIPIFILATVYVGFNAIKLIPVFLASWFLGSVTGFFEAYRAKSPVRFYAFANLMYYLLTVLPPVYYPVTVIPGIGMYIALLIPTVALSDLARIALSMGNPANLYYDLLVVSLYAVIMIILLVKYIEWREH